MKTCKLCGKRCEKQMRYCKACWAGFKASGARRAGNVSAAPRGEEKGGAA